MTDPAVEAAQRHAATKPYGFNSILSGEDLIAAAREMAKPLRELVSTLEAVAARENLATYTGMMAVIGSIKPLIFTTEELGA